MDSLVETYVNRNEPVPAQLEERKQAVQAERDALAAKVDPLVKVLEMEDVKEFMENTRHRDGSASILEYLQEKHDVCFCLIPSADAGFAIIRLFFQFKPDTVDELFKYARFLYDCGNYNAASVSFNLTSLIFINISGLHPLLSQSCTSH